MYEAVLLASILDRLAPKSILDIGSSSRPDREIIQPHIGAAFRGHNVIWTDLVASPGVLAADITDRSSLGGLPPCEMVTACSVLEHVSDIDNAIENLVWLTSKWLLVAVPNSYPPHELPLDNGWRPTPDELADSIASHGLSIIEKHATPKEWFSGVENASASLVVASREHNTNSTPSTVIHVDSGVLGSMSKPRGANT